MKAVEGILEQMSLERIPETNKDIKISDGREILIPTQFRQQVLDELYSTHLSGTSMKKMGRGKF